MSVSIAFYKKRVRVRDWRTFKEAAIDAVIRLITRSAYSHCELVFHRADGKFNCYTSSPRDGGVRLKVMRLPADAWDLVPVPISKSRVKRIHKCIAGSKYDFMGALLYRFGIHCKNRYFCSEYCAITLGTKPTLLSPQQLFELLTIDGDVYEYKKNRCRKRRSKG